jgi:DNA-binding beta-propeller fold protein YncE
LVDRLYASGEYAMIRRNYFVPLFVCLVISTVASAQVPLKLVQTLLMPSVPIGPYADHVTVDADGHRLFATPQAAKAVVVLDINTGSVLHVISGVGNPHAILYRGDLKRIYVADGGDGSLKIYSSETYLLLNTIQLKAGTDNLAYDPATKYLYVTNGGEADGKDLSLLSIIDTTAETKIGDIRIDADKLEQARIDSAASRLYVNAPLKNEIIVVDLKQQAQVDTWFLTKGKTNMSMALDSNQHRLYVGCRDTEVRGSVVIVDTQTGKEVDAFPIGGWVDDTIYDAKRNRIYAVTGVGEVYTFQGNKQGGYKALDLTDTAILAKTGTYSPELDRLFVVVPRLGFASSKARILAFQPTD